ncbi:hypothetical protein NLU13_3281 [Sarocladium strictum]|uniref:High-affinity methionine permease n=1 Tax=Sarocladium strictum TaxID=5046 RepID=A0AA39GLQ1_SARSR|nr:hypothetical protein NLU13_3281 [Sarocladium strictum]
MRTTSGRGQRGSDQGAPVTGTGADGGGKAMVPTVFQSNLANRLQQSTNRDAIVTEAPTEQSRLSFTDAACLVINRMIGTGIYASPQAVIRGTNSAGGAILLWFAGTLVSLAGVHVYIEYGLNVPRFVIDGVEQAVPRSGGDLHYLSYVYNWPYYAKGTVLYSACLYGISFICVGNMAGNSIGFGSRVLLAANPDAVPDAGTVCAIATAAGLFSCAIHAVSRKGGILLNDFFAVIKVCILLVIPAATLAVLGKGVKDASGATIHSIFQENLGSSVAFQPPTNASFSLLSDAELDKSVGVDGGANGYAAAFLSIIFAFGGIEQSNHVLGEIRTPRRTFPRALTFAVALVGLLYMVVNLCYMAVVPAHDQLQQDVALLFFRRVFSRPENSKLPDRVFNSFLALSSFGNIIVTTYTAARMKQEIAKQGFIPFSRFFAQNADFSIGRLVLHLRKKGWRVPFFASPEQHQEATPVGALVLHLGACLVLIWGVYRAGPDDGYRLLSTFTAYLITAFFGSFLALGILILRFYGPPATEAAKTEEYRATHAGNSSGQVPMRRTWRDMVGRSVYTWLSIPAAMLYFLGNAFPVIASWVEGASRLRSNKVKWFVVPTVCWSILGLATVWWLGFLAVGKYRQRRQHKTLVHEVWPEFDWAEPIGRHGDHGARSEKRQLDGGKILVHETVLFTWEVDEMSEFWGNQDAHAGDAAFDELLDAPMPPAAVFPTAGRQTRPEPQSMPRDDVAGTAFENFGAPAWNDTRTGNNANVPW